MKAKAEAGDQEAQSQLAERKQYQVRATVKSYRKMRDDALSGYYTSSGFRRKNHSYKVKSKVVVKCCPLN